MKEKESDKVTINKWGIVRDKKVEDYYWSCLSDYMDGVIRELVNNSYGDFDEFQSRLEYYLGSFTVLLIDKCDLNSRSFFSCREYFENIEDILAKEKIERILNTINSSKKISSFNDVPENEIAVLLFTDDWKFITYYGLNKEDTPNQTQFDNIF